MAANLNDTIRDLELRHHVGIQRLSSGILKKLVALLDQADSEIVAKLQARSPTLEGSFTSQRLQFLLRAIREINQDAHVQLGQDLRNELKDLARYEASFQADLLQNTIGVAVDIVSPSVQLLDAVVTSRPFEGRLLRDAVKDLSESKYKLLKSAIQRGIIQGETTDQIVRRVRGTKARNYRDGVLATSRTSAERVVRTSTNHVANAAREKLFEENDDLLKGYQWVATLDTATCVRCASLDSEVFKIGSGGPRPPLHLNCRCSLAPLTKSWRDLGINVDEMPPGTRASMNGQVSQTETFNSWLKKQSAATQDDALGKTRGSLFRRGGLSVDRFVDVRNNQLTLDELRAKEGGAFAKAGIAA